MKVQVLFFGVCVFTSTIVAAEDFKSFTAILNENAPLNRTSEFKNPALLPCVPLAGTKVKVLAQASQVGLPQFVSKVEVTDGQCKDTVGWVITSRLNAASN